MTVFADCSFVTALFRVQANTEAAENFRANFHEALPITDLLRYEFEQSVRHHMLRHRHDRTTGYAEGEGIAMLVEFEQQVVSGSLSLVAVDWAAWCEKARELSERHTLAAGHRAFDILHVAAALVHGARQFLTFDANQRKLAVAEGLAVPL